MKYRSVADRVGNEHSNSLLAITKAGDTSIAFQFTTCCSDVRFHRHILPHHNYLDLIYEDTVWEVWLFQAESKAAPWKKETLA